MHHLTKQSAVLCSGLQSEHFRKKEGECQVALCATSKLQKGAASHTQMALAHLYSLEASNAHKEKMYIY